MLLLLYTSDQPSKPKDIRLRLDTNILVINWNYPNISRLSLEFSISFRSAQSEMRSIVDGTHNYHQFSLNSTGDCQSIEVDITASNIAGEATSEIAQLIVPALPTNICHQMTRKDNGSVLLTSFKV